MKSITLYDKEPSSASTICIWFQMGVFAAHFMTVIFKQFLKIQW